MIVFIKNDGQPVARLGCGDSYPAFEFQGNRLLVDDNDTALLFALRGNNYKEVTVDDPRYQWIISQGWSRLSQQDYLRNNPPAPEEEPTPPEPEP